MNAERVLLDTARTSFARGDYAAALDALDRHRRAYSSGLLTEEREALAVRTLSALGRADEARARGRAFLAAHPSSVMVPAVEAAVSGSPDAG